MDAEQVELPLRLRVASARDLARGIKGFELVPMDAAAKLPAFTAGSHIRVRAPNGMLRKYSICSDPADQTRYCIAVKREESGRGGSRSLCDELGEGDPIDVSLPDNAFALDPAAKSYAFIAGGIGITPILSMIRSFGDMPLAAWKLVYLSRHREATAFLDELQARELRSRVTIHHSEGDPRRSFDLWPLLEQPKPGQHIYCCGSQRLMSAVKDMAGHWSSRQMHFESFVEGGQARPDDRPFRVRLASTGQEFEVPVGDTILQVLHRNGIKAASSCESGTCGTCRTRLVEGVADHRDMVLLPEETDTQIMTCVSRARSELLVIDL
ncbi:PDR/VanB family oxidoreductase [Thiomonas delicata]